MVIEGETGGMNKDFPGGKAGRRCGQIVVHGVETPVRMRELCREAGGRMQIRLRGISGFGG